MLNRAVTRDLPTGGDALGYSRERLGRSNRWEIALGGTAQLLDFDRTGDDLESWWSAPLKIDGHSPIWARSTCEFFSGVTGSSRVNIVWDVEEPPCVNLISGMPVVFHYGALNQGMTWTLDPVPAGQVAVTFMSCDDTTIQHGKILASPRHLSRFSPALGVKDRSQVSRAMTHQKPRDNMVAQSVHRLKEISGLDVDHLVDIFGVSRTSYYNWASGVTPHSAHRTHLLEILPLVEEVHDRFADAGATGSWLLKPVSAGGKKPIEYLAERNYYAFRGALLRVPNEQRLIRPLSHSAHIGGGLTRAEFDERITRLSPSQRKGDYDPLPDGDR